MDKSLAHPHWGNTPNRFTPEQMRAQRQQRTGLPATRNQDQNQWQHIGGPAIQPRSTSVPAFTEQDVRDYFNPDRPFPFAVVSKENPPTIVQSRFTTIHDLAVACGEIYWEANYPAELPICYVELSGRFPNHGPAKNTGAYFLFDARNGYHFASSGGVARVNWSRGDIPE
ncbi:MAG: hypothetical protein ACLQUY_17035 [Ktedonobacterales bacterium]